MKKHSWAWCSSPRPWPWSRSLVTCRPESTVCCIHIVASFWGTFSAKKRSQIWLLPEASLSSSFIYCICIEHKVLGNLGLGSGCCQRVGLVSHPLHIMLSSFIFALNTKKRSQSWLVAGIVLSVLYYSQNAKYRVLGVHALDCSYEYKPLFLQLN